MRQKQIFPTSTRKKQPQREDSVDSLQTTGYSAAELTELLGAAEKITDSGIDQTDRGSAALPLAIAPLQPHVESAQVGFIAIYFEETVAMLNEYDMEIPSPQSDFNMRSTPHWIN